MYFEFVWEYVRGQKVQKIDVCKECVREYVRVYGEEVYSGLGFEVVVLKWVVLCLMVLTQMVLWRVVLELMVLG